MSTPARRRLMRDFRRLQNDPPSGVTGAPMDNNILAWQVREVVGWPLELHSSKQQCDWFRFPSPRFRRCCTHLHLKGWFFHRISEFVLFVRVLLILSCKCYSVLKCRHGIQEQYCTDYAVLLQVLFSLHVFVPSCVYFLFVIIHTPWYHVCWMLPLYRL